MLPPFAPVMGPPIAGALALVPGWMDTTNRGRRLSINASRGPYAGPQGIVIGNFVWVDPDTGLSLNSQQNGIIAIAAIESFRYPVAFQKNNALMTSPGNTIYPWVSGYFWTMFPGGAIQNDPVYADNATGTPITGSSATATASKTSFSVYTPCKPGGLAIIENF